MAGDVGLVGTTVANRYHLVRLLGDGGMGSVYKAADELLHRFVALKQLHPPVAAKPTAMERFIREARTAAGIGHPNITDVLDFGHEGSTPYLVMEYLRGRPLSHVIAKEGPLGVERAARIATHTLAGLAAAHGRGIIHRDLKPANLMLIAHLGDPEFVKICDFGFATLLSDHDENQAEALTPARTLVGTPAYAAPERLRGSQPPDPRLDLYSLGVVLYEMVTGVRPFGGGTFADLARKIRQSPPPAPRALRPDIPKELEQVIFTALAKDPAKRYQQAADFAAALVPFGGRAVPQEDAPSEVFTASLLNIRARAAEASQEMPTHKTEPQRAGPPLPEVFSDSESHTSLIVPETSGPVVLALMRYVVETFGERSLKEVLDNLPQHSQDIFRRGVDPDSWVPTESVFALMQQVDAQLGHDDLHLVVQCGHAAAEGAVETLRALRPPAPPPEIVMQGMPAVIEGVFRGDECLMERMGKGHARLRITETISPTLTHCVSLLGFVDRSLERFGAAEVEVTLASCRALGDEQCLLDATWL